MKQLKVLLLLTVAVTASLSAQRRYFDEVFSNVSVSPDIPYAINATVLYLAAPPNGYGQAIPETLRFDLYSPETNSYLSILNNRNESHENDNNENTQEIDYLSMQIRANTGLEFDNQLELKLREFLKQNKFNSSTSSLFVLRALKSHMCNYLSYFENFQHVYQSPSALVSNIADDKNQNLANFDAKLEKLNIFPIGSEHFNAIHLERDEEIAIVNEILSSKGGFLFYLKKCA